VFVKDEGKALAAASHKNSVGSGLLAEPTRPLLF